MAWIRFSGVRGKGSCRSALLPLNLLIAFWQSARAIFAHRPDVVLGMGGYVAFPGGMMACLLNRPLVVHEQNSVAGLANRVLAHGRGQGARRVSRRVRQRARKRQWTGNPVRGDIAALRAARGALRRPRGAACACSWSAAARARGAERRRAARRSRSCRKRRGRSSRTRRARRISTRCAANYERAGVRAERGRVHRRHGASATREADLIICRAGASTIAELAAAGVPAVLVPFPYAVDDHQTRTRASSPSAAAAVLIPQSELTPEKLAELLAARPREAPRDGARGARRGQARRDAQRSRKPA